MSLLISGWARTGTDWEERECDSWDDDDVPCSFSGLTEVTKSPASNFMWWTCPICHTEHHEEMDDE